MTDGDPIDTPPLATDTEMDAWAAAGHARQDALEVLWHAQHTQRSGQGEGDCPFGDDAPVARQNWIEMFRMMVKAKGRRRENELAAAAAEPDRKRQWWQDM